MTDVETANRAIALRVAGASYDAIADRLDMTAKAVEDLVAAAMAANTRETRDTAARLDIARLDQLLAAVWKQAARGDSTAVAQALKITAQRATLLAHIGDDTSTAEGGPRVSIADRIAEIKNSTNPPELAVVHELEDRHGTGGST